MYKAECERDDQMDRCINLSVKEMVRWTDV